MITLHITRHGQPGRISKDQSGDPEYPTGDPGLTELGDKQAEMLGKRLSKEGFQGNIYSSPYRRTLRTAALVAQETGSEIYPEPRIQEIVPYPGKPDFKELTIEQIREKFDNIADDAQMDHPWLIKGQEDFKDTALRLEELVFQILKEITEGEVLLIGHGATLISGVDLFVPKEEKDTYIEGVSHWNCSLSTFGVKPRELADIIRLGDTSHIPDKFVTSNIYFKIEGK